MSETVYDQLNDRRVRDLYWLLFSPCPVRAIPAPWNARMFPETVIASWKATSAAYFTSLDRHPEMLHQFLNRKKYKRLGFYAEALLSFFFQTFDPIELLLQNFQVREEKQTLGEIDFIFNYDDVTYHIEVAVKYYLLLTSHDPDVPKNWVGPSRNDHFERKLNKIESRQLPLAEHPHVRKNITHQPVHSFFFLRGCFFAHGPVNSGILHPPKINTYHYVNEIDESIQLKQELIRPNWLSALQPTGNQEQPVPTRKSLATDRPSLWLNERNRPVFIVPDNWDQKDMD